MLNKQYLKDLVYQVNGAAIEVHKHIGPGLLESVYHRALLVELDRLEIKYESQAKLEVKYKGFIVGDFIADIIVENKVILELKVAKAITNEMQGQLMNYLKATSVKLGYVINFGNPKLEWKRIIF